jgi:RimJ/RimL family protein N-acetyltransferase
MGNSSTYLLRTSRLGMRRWKDSDLESFVAMNRDPRVMEFFPRIWTGEESAAMVARAEVGFRVERDERVWILHRYDYDAEDNT